ncbi:MAG: tetratricopeptide repeat protein [Saprospiraceae bacterium]|nr:tetratricopeptide repeat protein [Saprospiraceae bacterium]
MNLNAVSRSFLIILVFILGACSVQKSRNDVSKTGLFYHNLTAKYNGYFNAKELLDQSAEALDTRYVDNYTNVLELYKYNGIEDASDASANLDIAIKKASTVINLHRPSHWVGDSYLLIGQAQYYKKDYETAEETFKFMTQNYNKLHESPKTDSKAQAAKDRAVRVQEQIEKRETAQKDKEKLKKTQDKERKAKLKTRDQENKEKAKARKQLIKDRKKGIKRPAPATSKTTPKPAVNGRDSSATIAKTSKKEEKPKPEDVPEKTKAPKQKANTDQFCKMLKMWLAKTYIMRKNSIAAGIILHQLKSDPALYKELQPEIPILQAYNHIRAEEYEDAIPYLEEALALREVPNRRKARLAFVLGQLYSIQKNDVAAYDAFEKVSKLSPNYELEFFAKLNSAQKGMAAGKKSKDQLLDELKRLTKDDKNTDYGTAIYHTMALVTLADGQRDQAKEYLVTGLSHGGSATQKTESFYLLATLYNDDEVYLKAKNYYDSTLSVMGEKDLRRPEVMKYSASLTDIAQHISIIEVQDSLLLVSTWPEKDQKQWARKLLKEREKNLNVKVGLTPPSRQFDASALSRGNIDINPAKSTFFAYDEKALKKGIKDFENTWGNIKLQDNWRISQKIQNSFVDNNAQDPNKPNQETADASEDLASVLKDIPNTPELKDQAHEKIRNSMYALGVLYREKLENYPKSIAVLEELLQKYPASSIEQDVLYQLYLASMQHGDQIRATKYKERIITEYPGSKYAQSLLHPDFIETTEDKIAQLNKYYDETYRIFNSGECGEAMGRIHQVDSLFKENPLRAKFAMVEVLCTGKTQGKEAYQLALKDFIARYPQSAERDKAKDMLRYLMGDEKAFETPDILKVNQDPNAFEYLEDELHYVIAIVYDRKAATLSDLKISISDFNQKYFQNDDLKISNIFLDQDATIPIIMIRKFDNASKAIRYYETVKNNSKQFIAPEINNEVFAISQSNYRKLYATKDVESYKSFFKSKYGK